MHQFYIEFPDIESGDVFPVQVDDIAVGDALLTGTSEQGVLFTPGERILTDQAVVFTAEIIDQVIGQAQGENTAAGRG